MRGQTTVEWLELGVRVDVDKRKSTKGLKVEKKFAILHFHPIPRSISTLTFARSNINYMPQLHNRGGRSSSSSVAALLLLFMVDIKCAELGGRKIANLISQLLSSSLLVNFHRPLEGISRDISFLFYYTNVVLMDSHLMNFIPKDLSVIMITLRAMQHLITKWFAVATVEVLNYEWPELMRSLNAYREKW